MSVSELEVAVSSVSTGVLPPELPVAHLTTARWLMGIVDASQLIPRSCEIFNQDLLYFSYGGIFYRTFRARTENVSELPVGMVFSPKILDLCIKLFPFDSGAMSEKIFGETWYDAMHPFEKRFSISNDTLSASARLLVRALYKSNESYIEGRPIRTLLSASPTLRLLHDFLSADLSGQSEDQGGVDHRQRSIEALCNAPVPISDHLIWIGVPLSRSKEVLRGLRKCTRKYRNFIRTSTAGISVLTRLLNACKRELTRKFSAGMQNDGWP